MSPELISATGGGLMLVVAMSWRVLHRRRVDSRLAEALRDRDPVLRRAAVGVATEQGLRPYATLLIALAEKETDPQVRAALVEGVLRNAWEPADRPAILRLRLWAHEERVRWQAAPARLPRAVPAAVRAPVIGNRPAAAGDNGRPNVAPGVSAVAPAANPSPEELRPATADAHVTPGVALRLLDAGRRGAALPGVQPSRFMITDHGRPPESG